MQVSNIWWILGLIFIIIGIVSLILHFEKEKITSNKTIQRVTLYAGIILSVLGVILVGVWIIKKFSGKKKAASMPTNQNFSIGYQGDMNYPQTGYPMMQQPAVQANTYDSSAQMQGYPSQAMYGYGQ